MTKTFDKLQKKSKIKFIYSSGGRETCIRRRIRRAVRASFDLRAKRDTFDFRALRRAERGARI